MMEMQEGDDVALVLKEPALAPAPAPAPATAATSSSGWGGWGSGSWKSSAFSVLNEIQQAAADAAEEIQKNIVDGKPLQIQLTGFMEKNTGKFMKELWSLLISAQSNVSGIPQQF